MLLGFLRGLLSTGHFAPDLASTRPILGIRLLEVGVVSVRDLMAPCRPPAEDPIVYGQIYTVVLNAIVFVPFFSAL